MGNEIIIEQIKNQLYTKNGNLNSAVMRQGSFIAGELYKEIKEKSSFLKPDAVPAERIYCILNNITKIPCCKTCNSPLHWKGYRDKPYAQSCAKGTCKRNETKWKSSSEAKKIAEKEKKIDFESILQSNHDLIMDDELRTFCIERLKHSTPFVTSLLRTHPLHLSSLIKKSYLQYSSNIKWKWSQLFYDFTNNITEAPKCHKCNSPLNYRNSKFGYSTCAVKLCTQLLVAKTIKTNRNNQVREYLTSNGYDLLTQHGLNEGKHILRHQECGFEFEKYIAGGMWQHDIKCAQCHPNISTFELSVFRYIKEDLGIDCTSQVRDIIPPKEIDIYIPSKNIGIECNGLYWHSEEHGKDKNYHRNKYLECKGKGIQLIQIWESEWKTKQEIVKSIIASKLGVTSKRLFARKCDIRKVTDRHEKIKFLDENHIQGNDNSQISYGLYHNRELVSMMTFGHRKIVKGNYSDWEMIRFCNKLNHTIVGGASKLLSHFVSQHSPQNIITYADLRYSDGGLYHTLGFKHKHNSAPGYWYVINETLKHRSGFMKHRLGKILKEYDENLTEYQNMLNNGFYRIWDCGHAVFSYKQM